MTIQGFETLDQMFDALGSAMDAADKQVKAWQTEIKEGDYFLTIFEDMLIVNYCMGMVDNSKALQHYRFCESYSVSCESGESGDVHISQALIMLCEECGRDLIDYYKGILTPEKDSVIPELEIMCQKCRLDLLKPE